MVIHGPAMPIALTRIFFSLVVLSKYAGFFRFSIFKTCEIYSIHWLITLVSLILFYVSTISMLAGYKSRLASITTSLGCFVMYAYEPHHHTFILAAVIFLLGVAECGCNLSVDSLNKKKPKSVPYWPVILICAQMSAVYFWGAVDKLSFDFTSGARLESLFWTYWYGNTFEITPIIKSIVLFFSYSTIILELALAIGLWFKCVQLPLMVMGIIMHFLMHLWLPIGPFSLIVMWIYFLHYILIFKTSTHE